MCIIPFYFVKLFLTQLALTLLHKGHYSGFPSDAVDAAFLFSMVLVSFRLLSLFFFVGYFVCMLYIKMISSLFQNFLFNIFSFDLLA